MRNFDIEEFGCKHCGEVPMDSLFLMMLDDARDEAKTPFVITSGYRCPEHNRAVGGVEGSAHTKGHAVDIAAGSSGKKFKIIKALMGVGFTRIGVSSNFIHVDNDYSKSPNVVWTY